MSRMSSHDAWIGFAGVIAGALIGGFLALLPWLLEPDQAEDSREIIRDGIISLDEVPDPEQWLKQIVKLETILKLDDAFFLEQQLDDRRKRAEAARAARLEQEAADASARIAAEAEGQRVAAEILAADEAEKSRLRAEAAAAIQAIADEMARIAEAQRLAEEAALRAQVEKEKRLEAERAAAAAALKREIIDERVCRNESCTSWIIP